MINISVCNPNGMLHFQEDRAYIVICGIWTFFMINLSVCDPNGMLHFQMDCAYISKFWSINIFKIYFK